MSKLWGGAVRIEAEDGTCPALGGMNSVFLFRSLPIAGSSLRRLLVQDDRILFERPWLPKDPADAAMELRLKFPWKAPFMGQQHVPLPCLITGGYTYIYVLIIYVLYIYISLSPYMYMIYPSVTSLHICMIYPDIHGGYISINQS